jgi:O-antigen/teichoic acid export membrane protein
MMLKGFAWEAFAKTMAQALSWLSTLFVARLLAPSDYGIMAVASAFTVFLNLVVEMGLSQGLINRKEVTREEQDAVFYLSLAVSSSLYLILFFLSPAIARFYENPVIQDVLRLLGVTFILGSLKIVPLVNAMRNLNFRYRALVEMIAMISAAATSVVMAINGYGVWSLVAAVFVNEATSTILYLGSFGHVPRPVFELAKISSVIGFGARMMMSRILYFFYSNSDIFIIGRYLGAQQTGFYAMGLQLATIPIEKVGTIFHRVAFATLSRVKDDKQHSQQLFLKMHTYLLLLSCPIFIVMALLAEPLVSSILTDKWIPIVPLLQAFSIINVLRISGMLMTSSLAGYGRADLVLKYHVLSTLVLPLGFLVGVGYGLIGVLAVWLGAFPVLYLFLLFHTLRELDLPARHFLHSLVPVTVTSGLMAASIILMQLFLPHMSPFNALITQTVVGALTLLLSFFRFFPKPVREIKEGIRMIRA